ncbi:hypothetical protein MMC09_005334 [Bachmanniomyces sp. S44760]|nr:hypothetical protein [Bachmanniomyces sp. S44760]
MSAKDRRKLLAKTIHLDGTTLEGGGQLLRLALTLSCLTRIGIQVTDIRGNRASGNFSSRKERQSDAKNTTNKSDTKRSLRHSETKQSSKHAGSTRAGGGLKNSHLAAAEWLAKATAAESMGMEVGSSELIFQPPARESRLAPSPVDRLDDVGDTTYADGKSWERKDLNFGVWRDKIDNKSKLVRRESFTSMDSPGSVFLVFQAILPYLVFSASQTHDLVPFRISIEGGTNCARSLSYEYVDQVLIHMLQKIGVPPIKMTLNERGWSTGKTSIGEVTFDVTPLAPGSRLPAFSLTDPGPVHQIFVTLHAPNDEIGGMIREQIGLRVHEQWPTNIKPEWIVDERSGPGHLYLLLVAETANGFRIGRDWLYNRKVPAGPSERNAILVLLVNKVVGDLAAELATGAAVDEYMEDQLVVFQALANGISVVDHGSRAPSLHVRTVQWVVGEILGTRVEGGMGIGLRAGQPFVNEMKTGRDDDLVDGVGGLTLKEETQL